MLNLRMAEWTGRSRIPILSRIRLLRTALIKRSAYRIENLIHNMHAADPVQQYGVGNSSSSCYHRRLARGYDQVCVGEEGGSIFVS
jgi:hypothetical protein